MPTLPYGGTYFATYGQPHSNTHGGTKSFADGQPYARPDSPHGNAHA